MARKDVKPEHSINNAKLSKYVAKAQRGNKKALEYIVNITGDYIYYYCLTLLCDEDEAVDAVQDIYVILLEKLKTLKNPDAFLGWLKIVTSNYCKNRLARKNPVVSIEEYENTDFTEDDDIQINPEKSVEAEEVSEIIMTEIKLLPDVQKECVLMYYYHQLSIGEISEILEVNENTVKSRLFYARKAIKAGLEKYGKDAVMLGCISATLFENCQKLKIPMSVVQTVSIGSVAKISSVATVSVAAKAIAGVGIVASGLLVTGGVINYNMKHAENQSTSTVEQSTVATKYTEPSVQPTTSLNREMESVFYANGFDNSDRRTEIIYNEFEDLNSDNTKEYVYDLMCNAIDNYKTLKSTYYHADETSSGYVTYCFTFDDETKSKEITYDAEGRAISCEVYNGYESNSCPLDESANPTLLSSMKTTICEEISKQRDKRPSSLLESHSSAISDIDEKRKLDFASLVDSKKRYKKIDGEYTLVKRSDYANTTRAYEQYSPQSYAFNYMYDFDKWEIIGIDRMNENVDRDCFIIEGKANGFNNVYSYDMLVDTETGAMLYFSGRDKGGEDVSVIFTWEFIVDEPIDTLIFPEITRK